MDEEEGRRLERFVHHRWGRAQGGIAGLSTTTGITRETFYSWFRGDTDPSLSNLGVIAKALGVRRTEILAAMDGESPTVPLDEAFEQRVEERVLEALRRRRDAERA